MRRWEIQIWILFFFICRFLIRQVFTTAKHISSIPLVTVRI